LKIIESRSTTINPIKNSHVVDESRLLQIDHHPRIKTSVRMRTSVTNLPIYKLRKCPNTRHIEILGNARDRTSTTAARAREVDEVGRGAEAGVADAAAPLGAAGDRLRVRGTVRAAQSASNALVLARLAR
jgi:hypothetical protein